MLGTRLKNGLLIALLLGSGPLPAFPLTPFTATYEADFELGVGLAGDAVRTLKKLPNGDWRLAVEADVQVAEFRESTQFRLYEERVRPLRYDYRRKVFGKKRSATLTFDWQALSVLNDVEDRPWKMQVPPDAHDKLSYQIQLRRDLAAGNTEMSYPVADGGRIKTYRFGVLGQESVRTPAGRFQALKVERLRDPDSERKTLIWFAPALDYAIVKLAQTEDDGKEYRLLLKAIDTKAP
ncbi:DUF3108 domain-containing protein [Motiliproteus sp. SC1-56]|uniref:DUF3108 domain-containing protein n=1 Tax=Motiliproteus sp. SC1-56 TaxID=2799565 RepID=UPI001A8FAB28|nr:DUF3108 domain-containing protein [Motiliproteus sp. SC1-56]